MRTELVSHGLLYSNVPPEHGINGALVQSAAIIKVVSQSF